MVEDKTYGDPAVERDPYPEEGERADVFRIGPNEGDNLVVNTKTLKRRTP